MSDADGRVIIDTELDTTKAEKQANGLGSKLKTSLSKGIGVAANIATAALKGTAVAVAGTATAIAGLSVQAVQAYSSYEQLVGGVNTLFGAGDKSLQEYADSVGKSVEEVRGEYNSLMTAQSTVMKNAAEAYKNAGLSANAYMEQISGFAASLVQSLGGDTEKAAEVGNRAIEDMADNANKMGTAMESIQNAYQGFAKQNYTMLDNLKLGYGGTKTEMERLIADASQLTDIQEKLGITVEEGSLDFANVINAISVIQSKLNITGTTQNEAMSTIQGSAAMTKAAWENVLVGISDDSQDFDSLIDNLVTSVTAFAGNIVPRIEQSIAGAGRLVSSLAPVLSEQLPKLISDTLPALIDSASSTVSSVVDAIISVLPTVATKIIPSVLSAGINILTSVVGGITNALPSILDAIVTVISTLASNSSQIFDMAFSLIYGLISAISQSLPELLTAGMLILQGLAQSINDNLPTLVPVALDLILALVDSLDQAFPLLLEIIPVLMEGVFKLLSALISESGIKLTEAVFKILWILIKNIPNYLYMLLQVTISFIGQLVMGFVDGFNNIVENARQWGIEFGTKLAGWLADIVPSMKESGDNIVNGLWEGISNAWSNLTSHVTKLCDNLIGDVKSAFNIHSPSKEFEWIGKMNAEGMVVGFDDVDPVGQITDSLINGQQSLQNSIQSDYSATSEMTSSALGNLGNGMNISVILQGDAKGVFKLVKVQNDIYKKAVGVSALA